MSARCDFIDDITPLPDATTSYREPFLHIMKPCAEPALIVRYHGGIIVGGYCRRHAELKGMSLTPWPHSGWEIYSDAKFYGVAALKAEQEE